MLVVETIGKIRRAYFAQKKPIKAICREFRVSRKVVRKVIRSQATEFRYERGRQPLPRIDPWRDQLDGLLLANEGKPSRERLTLIRIFEELRGLGYEGSYDAVRRYARKWRVERGAATAEAFVPLSFAPGEAYQFDLVARGCDQRHHGHRESGACPAVHSRMLFVRPTFFFFSDCILLVCMVNGLRISLSLASHKGLLSHSRFGLILRYLFIMLILILNLFIFYIFSCYCLFVYGI